MNKNRDINNDHNNDYNNRKGFLTSSCNNKKTRLIFDNVTKQLRFKNSARSINASLSYYNHYIRPLLLLFEYIS